MELCQIFEVCPAMTGPWMQHSGSCHRTPRLPNLRWCLTMDLEEDLTTLKWQAKMTWMRGKVGKHAGSNKGQHRKTNIHFTTLLGPHWKNKDCRVVNTSGQCCVNRHTFKVSPTTWIRLQPYLQNNHLLQSATLLIVRYDPKTPKRNLTTKREGTVYLRISATSLNLNFIFVGKCNASLSYDYLGCFWEYTVRYLPYYKVLPVTLPPDRRNTPEKCIANCRNKRYRFAGVQEELCFCGQLQPWDMLKVNESWCNDPCTGNANRKCGGIIGRPLLINAYFIRENGKFLIQK